MADTTLLRPWSAAASLGAPPSERTDQRAAAIAERDAFAALAAGCHQIAALLSLLRVSGKRSLPEAAIAEPRVSSECPIQRSLPRILVRTAATQGLESKVSMDKRRAADPVQRFEGVLDVHKLLGGM